MPLRPDQPLFTQSVTQSHHRQHSLFSCLLSSLRGATFHNHWRWFRSLVPARSGGAGCGWRLACLPAARWLLSRQAHVWSVHGAGCQLDGSTPLLSSRSVSRALFLSLQQQLFHASSSLVIARAREPSFLPTWRLLLPPLLRLWWCAAAPAGRVWRWRWWWWCWTAARRVCRAVVCAALSLGGGRAGAVIRPIDSFMISFHAFIHVSPST